MRSTPTRTLRTPLGIALGAVLGLVLPAGLAAAQGRAAVRRAPDPRLETLVRLSEPITIDRLDNRVADVMDMIAERTGADLDVMYLDDRHDEGFEPGWTVTMTVGKLSALELIERIVTRANSELDPITAFEWQLTEQGTMQVGPKARLNGTRRTVVYDIHDLLFEIPSFDNAPEFDLSSALQSGSSGGSTGSPFTSTGGQDPDRKSKDERAEELIELIQATIEPDQWEALGGTAARLSYIPEQLIVTAPDYIHRKIAGYRFWPRRLQVARLSEGRREMDILPARPRTP